MLACDALIVWSRCLSARKEEDKSRQRLLYCLAETQGLSFLSVFNEFVSQADNSTSPQKGGDTNSDTQKLYQQTLALTCEASLRLENWSNSKNLLTHAAQDPQSFEAAVTMTELVLASHAPAEVTQAALEQVIILASENKSGEQLLTNRALPRYIRMLFHVLAGSEQANLVQVYCGTIAHACDLADRGAKSLPHDDDNGLGQYPDDELEWLATTVFNCAIDALCACREQDYNQLAEHAIMVAERVGDRGALRKMLEHKMAALA